MTSDIRYKLAETHDDYCNARLLFEEYALSLNVDLSFQDFKQELATIDKQYTSPTGGLLLAYGGNYPIACVGIRKLDEQTAELKRMYVKREFRDRGIGVQLLLRSIALAQQLAYKKIRLDTLANMHKAQKLYLAAGFKEIPSYRFNPIHGTIYLEKEL